MSNHYFIESKLHGHHVVDIKDSLDVSGTPLDANKRKEHKYGHQVWEFVKSPIEGYFYIENPATSLVIDIREPHGPTPPPPSGTKLDAHTKKTTAGHFNGQLWRLSEDAQTGWYYIESYVNGYVIDVEGASTTAGALLDAATRNPPAHKDSQLWKRVQV
jgi:Ricin-type beta-trefoil lectin domain-like